MSGQNSHPTSQIASGQASDLELTRHPDLYYVGITLSLPCGRDDTLHLLRVSGGRLWRELTAGSHSYPSSSPGQHSLTYAVSPADPGGNYFVALAHLNPGCSSEWRTIEYRVLAASGDPDTPRVLAYDNALARLDERIWVEATASGASIHFVGGSMGSPSQQTRSYVRGAATFGR